MMSGDELRQPFVEIPAHIEKALTGAVARRLEIALGERGLLLAANRAAEAEAEAAQQGARLLTCVIDRCYPAIREGRSEIKFESEPDRLAAALAFGAVTARVLAPVEDHSDELSGSVELTCALLNLGVGLVDSLCDQDVATGRALLELIEEHDLVMRAEEPRGRGWLRGTLPPALAPDHAVVFTVDVIEVFFETLHATFPRDEWCQQRRAVGTQLQAALEAERRSVNYLMDQSAPQQLIECSRLTSVIPFQIIEALARGCHPPTERTAGTAIGEAVWRIDDLVDLCQDAHCGALNSVLLAALDGAGRSRGERDGRGALERLLTSTDIADTAAHAAESLRAGLQLAYRGRATDEDDLPGGVFLYFIQRYAGIPPR
jgi:hypothetical protein